GAMHELKKLAFLDSIREISKWIFNQEMTPLELALQFHPYDMVHGISATLPDVSTPLLAPHRIQDGINGSTRAVRVKLYPEDVVNMRLLAQGVGPDFAVRFLPDQFLEDGFLKSSAYKQQRYRIDCPFF
ncbi:hypothetical protein KC660_02450, partial [Candidatus Dojkabacteria bacterium]|nr:hypothetical protein [Candidatus Dojkabacteria bacterium]